MMETTLISHISRQVSLLSFPTGMSVVRMTVWISFIDNLEVPLTTVYVCVCMNDNYIKIIRSLRCYSLCCCLRLCVFSLLRSLSLSVSISSCATLTHISTHARIVAHSDTRTHLLLLPLNFPCICHPVGKTYFKLNLQRFCQLCFLLGLFESYL